MKLMRKYRVFVCAVLILCFFSFQISRPRQALAIVPAVSLAAAAVLAVGAAAGLSYTFDNANAESIAGRLQAFLDDVHPGTSIANYFSARGAAVKDGLMYIGRSLYNRIKEFLQWESSNIGDTFTYGENAFLTYDDILYQTCTYGKKNSTYFFNDDGINLPLTYNFDITLKYTDSCFWRLCYDNSYLVSYRSSDSGVTYEQFYRYSLGSNFDNHSDSYFLTFAFYSISDYGVFPFPVVYYTYTGQDDSVNSPTFGYYRGKFQGSTASNPVLPWNSNVIGDLSGSISQAGSITLTGSDVISYPEVSEGQSVCVDVGMLTGSTIDEVADEIIDAAIDGVLSPSISAETWTVDVVTTPQELAQDLDQDLTTDVEDNPTVPDTERIEFDPPAHYTVRDLRTFFPFCIPFDLFDMLGVLAAQPVAPHFEYRFQPGIANIDYTIVIDFQQFDSVALLLRRLETLSFCIGLAMVTRNLIRG